MLVLNTKRFGRASQPVKKCWWTAYWLRRFYAANPFLIPESPDGVAARVCTHVVLMAQMARSVVERITGCQADTTILGSQVCLLHSGTFAISLLLYCRYMDLLAEY